MKTINDTFKENSAILNNVKEINSYTELITHCSSNVKKPIFEENLLTVLSWILTCICILASISFFFKEEYIFSISLLFGSIMSHCILRILCNISINLDSINKKLNNENR